MSAAIELGEIVRFHRKKLGLTQIELALEAGVGKTVVFDIERGKETVQVDTLSKVLTTLKIRVKLESSLMQEYALSRMEDFRKT
ncbi:MAG: helix-turn-helix transcriptional regulator [Ignavibacteriales bacterium]|nr:helix-turn-helix transcriptional regulator [Ignavibacteriales bacterium]